jgi:glycosyltransferase involved in cell wall biosynthesis
MRIRFYHKSLWPKYKGAIFTHVYALSQKAGVEVSFAHVAETDEIRLALGGVDRSYHQYPYSVLLPGSYEDAPLFKRITTLIRDLVHHPADFTVLPGYDRLENWMLLLACMLLRRRRAVFCDSTIYDSPPIRWKRWAKSFFFRNCDGYIGYGQRSKEYMVSLGARGENVVIPCQAAALPHDYDAQSVMARYQRQDIPVSREGEFLYVGRLAPEKGLFDLLAALRLVREQLPGARLHLVGDGLLKKPLRQRAAELGLAEAIEIHGAMKLEQFQPFYFSSWALVLPSLREPWGLVANEALSYGCPIVVSDHCGCVPELVTDGTGFRFETGSTEQLAQAMLATRQLCADRVATARRCIELIEGYSPEHAAERMLQGCMALAEAQKVS